MLEKNDLETITKILYEKHPEFFGCEWVLVGYNREGQYCVMTSLYDADGILPLDSVLRSMYKDLERVKKEMGVTEDTINPAWFKEKT